MVNRNGNSQYVTSGRIFTPTPVNRYLTFISGRGRATKGHRCKLSRSSRYEKTKWYVLTVKQDMFMEPTSETYSANVWVWSVYRFHEFHQRTDSIALLSLCACACVCVWSQYYCLMFSFLFRPEESPTAKPMPTRMFDRKIFAFCFFPCRCYEL